MFTFSAYEDDDKDNVDNLAIDNMTAFMKKVETASPLFYKDDTALPILCYISSKRNRLFGIKDIVSCIMHPSPNSNFFCSKVPTCISDNVVFLVDTNRLDNPRDIDCDDMGVWRNNRVDTTYVNVQVNSTEVKTVTVCKSTRPSKFYEVKRVYRVHGTDCSLRKITAEIYGN